MGTTVTDAELIAASRRGERAAFGHLVERYLGLVCAVSYSTTRNQALSEDVAQDTFIAAWAQLDQLRETSRLRSWLCGIARNLARKARARGAREAPHERIDEAPVTMWPSSTIGPFEAVSQAETERVVWDALTRVPAAYREVLVLYYQQQRSIGEVAHQLGISEDAALQRLTRGRRQLAGEVTAAIEVTLERARPRPGLAAAVMAALPPLPPLPTAPFAPTTWPHVATSAAPGARMFKPSMFAKVALAVTAAAGLAGITYVAAADRGAARPPPPPAVSGTRTSGPPTMAAPIAAAPVARAPVAPGRPVVAPPPAGAAPAAAPGKCGDCPDGAVFIADDGEQIDGALIEQTGLYRGPARGPADAPVEIAVFMDLECPFCAMVLGTIDQLWDEYPGQLRLVVKQFPLPAHHHAALAAEASLAAEAQGRFWQFHDAALAFQDDLDRAALIDLAGRAGLDVAVFTRALDQHTYQPAVARDLAAAQQLDVQGTPSFFINGRRFTGAQPIAEFRAAIDRALSTRTK